MNYASPSSTRMPSLPSMLHSSEAGRRSLEHDWNSFGLADLAATKGKNKVPGAIDDGQDHDRGDRGGGGGGGDGQTPAFQLDSIDVRQNNAEDFDSKRQSSGAGIYRRNSTAKTPLDTPGETVPALLSTLSPSQTYDGEGRDGNSSDGDFPRGRWAKIKWFLKMQLKYLGPGITMSVAYCDPGNWSTDLEAGSQFGYPLLFIILLTGLFGIILQILSLRMGIVCNKDMAVLTKEWVLGLGMDSQDQAHNAAAAAARAAGKTTLSQRRQARPSHLQLRPLPGKSAWAQRGRIALLWTLYLVAEGAIICTELAELVGSAIALNLLFPKLPLWGGVLVTSLDVFLILFIYRPDTQSIRVFEACIGALVLVVISCLIALVVKVNPYWPDVFHGYLPSSAIVGPQALYVGIGILGATCMPHGLFLGSHFAMFEREQVSSKEEAQFSSDSLARSGDDESDSQADNNASSDQSRGAVARRHKNVHAFCLWLARKLPGIDPAALGLEPTSRRGRRPSRAGNFTEGLSKGSDTNPRALRRRIMHSTIDVTLSMLMFAITTNSALLIVAAQAFYFGLGNTDGSHGSIVVGDLFEAFELLKNKLNHASAILFAVALLAAGQSASITVTLAGQIISEGMIDWRTNPFIRRCVTRLITLIPSFAVAAAVGRSGLDQMLVASQVALSMALPFVLLPLLVITDSTKWMRVSVASDNQQQQSQRPPVSRSQAVTLRQKLTSWSWWMRYSGDTLTSQGQVAQQPSGRRASRGQAAEEAVDEGNDAKSAPSSPYAYKYIHYANSWITVAVTSAIFVIIVLADGFVIITTAMGTGGAS